MFQSTGDYSQYTLDTLKKIQSSNKRATIIIIIVYVVSLYGFIDIISTSGWPEYIKIIAGVFIVLTTTIMVGIGTVESLFDMIKINEEIKLKNE